MSKKDMRAKKLLLAVLLAISVQSFYTSPAWANEAGKPAGQTEIIGPQNTASAGQTDTAAVTGEEAVATKEQSEQENEKTEGTENTEAVSVTAPSNVIYKARTAAIISEDYGVMPLAATGPLTNVTSINNVDVNIGGTVIAIGSKATSASSVAIGTGITLYASYDKSVAIGANVRIEAGEGVAVGFGANSNGTKGVALGNSAFASAANSVAIGSDSVASNASVVSFGHKVGNPLADFSTTYKDDLFRSLVNVANIEMHGGLTGVTKVNDIIFSGSTISSVTSINDIAIDSSRNLTNAGTYNTVTISASGISGTDTFNDVTIGLKGGAGADSGNIILGDASGGTIDVTVLNANTKGITRDATTSTTTIEGNTTITAGGIAANSFTVAVGSDTYGMDSTGALTATSINGKSIDSLGGTDFTNITTNVNVKASAAAGADTTFSIDQATGNITTSGTINEVTIGLKGGIGSDSDNVILGNASGGTIDVTALDANTAGIKRDTLTATTTIETHTTINSDGLTTNKLTVSGMTTTTLENGKLTVGDVRITGGKVSGLTAGDITSANSTDAVTGGQLFTAKAELNTAIGTKVNADASSLSDENKTAWKSALGVDTLATTVTGHGTDIGTLKTTVGDANSGLVKRTGTLETAVNDTTKGLSATYTKAEANATSIGELKAVTAGMSYSGTVGSEMTTFTGGVTANSFAVGTTGYGFSSTGALKAKTVNGVTIKKENGADNTEEIIVGGINLSQLQSNGGTGTNTDTEGIKRTYASGDGTKDTTTIETVTSFTSAGMKTANLEAATAKIGNVQFAAGGVVTNVVNINGISFADGKIGGVAFSNGNITGGTYNGAAITSTSFNGVNIKELQNKVNNLTPGTGGGGTPGTGGDNAFDSITVAGTSDNKTTISDKGIVVAEGKTNEVTINDKGIHVGKNSSVMNDTEGFITDKGLYIGVNSSNDISTAKFSIDSSSGALTSNVDGHKFANDGNGAVFSKGDGSDKTTINGGKIETNELWVGGNQVTVSGGTVNQTDAIDNQLTATKDGYDYTNGFTTTQTEGTTQSASKESTDKKNKWETTNNTSADGTSIKTTHTSTDSSDNKTEQSSSVVTNANGMTVSTSNKVTDKDGKVTEETTGSTTIGGGEVTLRCEDGSTIRVGEAIEGMQGQIQDIGSKVNEMGVEIKEVGALSAALAGLHPQPENANSRADFAMAMGSYEGKQALAVGGFYRPDKRTMLSIGASTTSSKHMMNMGISIALDRMPEEKRKAQEAAAADPETLNKVLERLAALEQDNQRLQADNKKRDIAYEKLAADYTQLKEKYTEKTAEKQQSETKLEEAAPAEADSSSEE